MALEKIFVILETRNVSIVIVLLVFFALGYWVGQGTQRRNLCRATLWAIEQQGLP
jgi:hypothetical protein